MSTSALTVTRDDVIKVALKGLSTLEQGATPTADAVTDAALMLNFIIKNWQKDGIKIWTVSEIQVPLVANKTIYTLGLVGCDVTTDKPMSVSQAFLRNISVTPNIDIPMQVVSRQEYNMLGSKFSQGVINTVYYTPGISTGSVSVFLTPDNFTATQYVLYLTVKRELKVPELSTDTFDLPSEWLLPLKWALMAELSSDYDKSIQDRTYYDQKAMYFLTKVEDADVETTSSFFTPDQRMSK